MELALKVQLSSIGVSSSSLVGTGACEAVAKHFGQQHSSAEHWSGYWANGRVARATRGSHTCKGAVYSQSQSNSSRTQPSVFSMQYSVAPASPTPVIATNQSSGHLSHTQTHPACMVISSSAACCPSCSRGLSSPPRLKLSSLVKGAFPARHQHTQQQRPTSAAEQVEAYWHRHE